MTTPDINEVYRTVLFILNKEQRGYMTPAEFNHVGNQSQLEIFEGYFEDYNQLSRIPQPDSEYYNRIENIDEKVSLFKTTLGSLNNSGFSTLANTRFAAISLTSSPCK